MDCLRRPRMDSMGVGMEAGAVIEVIDVQGVLHGVQNQDRCCFPANTLPTW